MMETYNYIFIESSLPLTREWPLMSSPFPLLFIILVYLYFVLYAGPHYMQYRTPYKLKTFILIYNLIQICTNIWIIKEHIAFGWITKYGVICSKFPRLILDDPALIRFYSCVWWLLLLKIFDLVETCVFVLRKKQNQVSTLHVYHHISNIVFTWIYLKYILEAKAGIISLINCAVHVIMYIYYFLSARKKYQQILSLFKPYITRIQMVQFVGMIIFLLQVMQPDCHLSVSINVALPLTFLFIGNLLIFLYLFYDFYRKSYTKVSKKD